MDIENYSNISGGVVTRAKMTIHANDIIPNPSYDAASLEAGSFYAYGVQKVRSYYNVFPSKKYFSKDLNVYNSIRIIENFKFLSIKDFHLYLEHCTYYKIKYAANPL